MASNPDDFITPSHDDIGYDAAIAKHQIHTMGTHVVLGQGQDFFLHLRWQSQHYHPSGN